MKFFLDTADRRAWNRPAGCPPLQGATTNPTLVRRAGLPVTLDSYRSLLDQAGAAGLPELMLQLPSSELAEAGAWLDPLQRAAEQARVAMTIKLPCHPAWEALLHEAKSRSLPVLLTGLSNPMQLLWAHALGADYVAPYLGRLQAEGRDIDTLVRACVALQNGGGPRLLAASIRTPDVLGLLIASGAYAVTLRPEYAAEWATDPLTAAAIAEFEADVRLSRLEPGGRAGDVDVSR